MDTINNSSQDHSSYISSSAYAEEESEELLELTTMDLCDESLARYYTICTYIVYIYYLYRSCLQMFFKTGALKNFAILTGKHLCWSLF